MLVRAHWGGQPFKNWLIPLLCVCVCVCVWVVASFNGWILPWPEKPPWQSVTVSTSPHRSGRMTHYSLPSLQHERKGQIFSRSHFLNKHGLDTRHRACDGQTLCVDNCRGSPRQEVSCCDCGEGLNVLLGGRGAVWLSLVNVHSGILRFLLQHLQAEWSTNPVFKSVFSLSWTFFIFFISSSSAVPPLIAWHLDITMSHIYNVCL